MTHVRTIKATMLWSMMVLSAIAIGVVVGQDSTNTSTTTAAPTTTTAAPTTTTTTTAAPTTTTTTAAPTTTTTTTAAPTTTTAAPTTTVAPLPAGSLRSYVFLDSTMTSTNLSYIASAVDTYLAGISIDAISLFASRPQIIDTKGDVLLALSALQGLVASNASFPDLIFIGARTDVSLALSDVLKQNAKTATIPLISIHVANTRMCDATTNPMTICLVPRDYFNVRATIQMVSTKLNWASVAVVVSNDEYGNGINAVLSSELLASASAPTVVTQMVMPRVKTSNASDEQVVKSLIQYNPVGVLAFVNDREIVRLREAAVRLGLSTSSIFFLGGREALNIIATMTGAKTTLQTIPLWGAIVAPEFRAMEQWVTSGTVPANAMDQMGAFVLSYLLDGIRLVMNARSANIAQMRAATVLNGYTGTVSLDSVSYQRSSVIFRLISATYDITRSLVTWSITSLNANPVVDISTTTISQIIAPSPLLAVTVCMTAPSSCVDIANVNALLYYFVNSNANRKSNTSVSFIPMPVYTGSSGVEGLSNLIPVARSCTFLTGPGRSNVASALTPVINQFQIPQLDYSTASGVFSNLLQYPYFSRTIPRETFQYVALGETASYFGWERVILISTNDAFGTESMASAQSSFDDKTILVEATYSLADTKNATIAGVFQEIMRTAITRVIVFLIPLQGDDAANFYNLVAILGMTNPSTQYIFFLSNDLCQYGLSVPSARLSLLSSICITPWVDPAVFQVTQQAYLNSGLQSQLQQILYQGGFTGVADCNLVNISTYSAFALDTGAVISDVITRAQAQGISFTDSGSLLPLVRATKVTTASGTFSVDANGDRDYAAYNLNIQTLGGLVTFAKWDTKAFPNYVVDASTTITWFDNTTSIPSSTFRSISFITETTISTNPGTIVLSALGFAGTVAVFFFCYRHYKMQRLIELSLESGEGVSIKSYREREVA